MTTLSIYNYKTGFAKLFEFHEKKDFSILNEMVSNFGTIPKKEQAANLNLRHGSAF